MNKILRLGAALAIALAASAAIAQSAGQVQAITPLTRDIGSVKTFTAQGAATVTSADQTGYNVARVVCVYRQSTSTGSPSTTFKIQNKDAISAQYYDLVQSSAITDTTATKLAAGAGVATTANVSIGFPVAAKWRVSITVGGSSTPTVTGTVGCSVQ